MYASFWTNNGSISEEWFSMAENYNKKRANPFVWVQNLHPGRAHSGASSWPWWRHNVDTSSHYNDVIMGLKASLITRLTSVYSTAYSGVDQRKHQRSASLAFVPGIQRGPVNSPHKWPVTRKMFPFDDVSMRILALCIGKPPVRNIFLKCR